MKSKETRETCVQAAIEQLLPELRVMHGGQAHVDQVEFRESTGRWEYRVDATGFRPLSPLLSSRLYRDENSKSAICEYFTDEKTQLESFIKPLVEELFRIVPDAQLGDNTSIDDHANNTAGMIASELCRANDVTNLDSEFIRVRGDHAKPEDYARHISQKFRIHNWLNADADRKDRETTPVEQRFQEWLRTAVHGDPLYCQNSIRKRTRNLKDGLFLLHVSTDYQCSLGRTVLCHCERCKGGERMIGIEGSCPRNPALNATIVNKLPEKLEEVHFVHVDGLVPRDVLECPACQSLFVAPEDWETTVKLQLATQLILEIEKDPGSFFAQSSGRLKLVSIEKICCSPRIKSIFEFVRRELKLNAFTEQPQRSRYKGLADSHSLRCPHENCSFEENIHSQDSFQNRGERRFQAREFLTAMLLDKQREKEERLQHETEERHEATYEY